MTTLTHDVINEIINAVGTHFVLPIDEARALARIARAAIAADAMDHNPRTAQAMALRDLLIAEGLRKWPSAA